MVRSKQEVVTISYIGNENQVAEKFHIAAKKMLSQEYYPTSQNWVPDQYGCASFLLALLLCLIFIGVIVFI